MPNTLKSDGDIDGRFAKALTRLVKFFNLIDENVGLAIAHLDAPEAPESVFPRLARMSTERKLKRLQALLASRVDDGAERCASDYDLWRQEADLARHIRNRYLHSHWTLFPYRSEQQIELRAPAWQKDAWGNQNMDVAELEILAAQLEAVFKGFRRFRDKHKI